MSIMAKTAKIFIMKNLKKLSRGEMKTIEGGEWGWWACCGSGSCSTSTYGDSSDLVCITPGTRLTKMFSPL